jgi:uncharacterized membrane protein
VTTNGIPPITAPTTVPLSARRGQRIATYVLLAVSLVGVVVALFVGPLPLFRALGGAQAMAQNLHIPLSKCSFLVFSAYSQLVLFVASAVISFRLLSRRKVSFYVPLAAGALAAIIFWIALALALLAR